MVAIRTYSKKPLSIRAHVFATYESLRTGLAILAVLFPIVLYAVGKWAYELPLQPSMSAYFFAAGDASMCTSFPMRTYFVGLLCAICAGLHLYKGFSKWENRFLNAAAVAGAVVAVKPERLDDAQVKVCEGLRVLADAQQGQLPWHYIAAVLMFVCLAVVAWRFAADTLRWLPPEHKHRESRFRAAYKTIALLMLGFPVLGVVLGYVLGKSSTVFYVEALGIWTFAAYWIVKTREMVLSKAESLALEGKAEMPRTLPE